MSENKLIKPETLSAITNSEISQQVETAKKYPRNVQKALEDIKFYSTIDKETAESCFYAIPRANKTIIGGSVRLAEIVLMCWGNLRVGSRIIANDGRVITAQGIAFDSENNVSVSQEVHTRITDRNGNTYSEDMQIVSANRACAMAIRNVVFKIVPKVITGAVERHIKNVIVGQESDFETIRKKAVEYFTKQGVTETQILTVLGKDKIENIDKDDIFILRATATAIKEGDTTIKQAFGMEKIAGMGTGKTGTSKMHDSFGNKEEKGGDNE